MRITNRFDHLNALEIVKNKTDIFTELNCILNEKAIQFGSMRPKEIKTKVNSSFNKLGWADRVRVHHRSRLTISFLKNRVGVCIQLGNVSRTYADVLKLNLLGNRGVIDVGCIVVPDGVESRLLGANYARFDRLKRELIVFKEIIETPILVLALGN